MNKRIFTFCLFIGFGIATYIYFPNHNLASREQNLSSGLATTKAPLKTFPEIVNASVPSEQREIDESAIKQLIQKNDYCGLMRLIGTGPLSRSNSQVLADTLLNGRDLLPHSSDEDKNLRLLYEGFTGNGMSGGSSVSFDGNEILQFYNALLLSDLLAGIKSPNIDLKEADSLLTKLEFDNPQNGAFAYFLAKVKEKEGFPYNEIKNQLLLAFRATVFDTFLMRITQFLHERGLQDSTTSLVAIMVIQRLPIPDLNACYFMVMKYMATDSELVGPVIEFSKKLMGSGIQFGADREEFIYWMALEYALGQKMFTKAWNLQNPNVAPEKKYSVTYHELMDKNQANLAAKRNWEGDFFEKITESADYCPHEKIEELVKLQRREFLDFKRESHSL